MSTPIPSLDHSRLNQAIADFALLTFENSEAFENLVGPLPYEVDLPTGRLTIGSRTFSVVSLGTWSEHSNTWLWTWANSGHGFPDDHPAVAPVVRGLRDRADHYGLPQFAEPMISVEGINDLSWHPAIGLAWVAAHLVGGQSLRSAGYDGGRAFFAVMDAPPAQPSPLKLGRYTSMAWQAQAKSPTADRDGVRHRQALTQYARWRGLQHETLPDSSLVIHWPQGSKVEVQFDDLGREVNLRSTITAGDVPPLLPHEERDEPSVEASEN